MGEGADILNIGSFGVPERVVQWIWYCRNGKCGFFLLHEGWLWYWNRSTWLDPGGFNAQLETQSASALASINVAFAWVPVITSVICVVCMIFFDVDKYYGKVVKGLSQGK